MFSKRGKSRAQALADLSEHLKLPESCSLGNPELREGITDEQWELLGENSPRKLSVVEKWWIIWDIIFPGKQRPPHPCQSPLGHLVKYI
jgi:hypothetical protein